MKEDSARAGRAHELLIVAGRATPSLLVSHELSLDEAAAAYDKFDKRIDGYTKVLLHPTA
jgi:glutathione-independent formaldehyde dehydrogenase